MAVKIYAAFLRFYWILSAQFGIDPRLLVRSLRGLPRYIRDYARFRSSYKGPLEVVPCLHDWYEEGGTTKTEYFWQDLLVAREIFAAKPDKHVDIGSRVDGFVAHVASFRDIEVFDVRPISTRIPGIIFAQADLMQPIERRDGYCDSVSCLHALEHFGLGRYNDPISPSGYELAFKNIANLLRQEGRFYLSIPIGIQRVEFNAQRVFDPVTIVNMANANSLKWKSLTVIRQGHRIEVLGPNDQQLVDISRERYVLGIFTFVKK